MKATDLLTVKETADYLQIPRPTVYYLVQRGKLPAIQIGGRWRVKKSALDRKYFRDNKKKNATGASVPAVLVVDDDPALQKLFGHFFKSAGYAHTSAMTAAEAGAKLRESKFDLVFLDLQLPDAGGDEVFQDLKKLHPNLPVVIITGYPDSKILDRILEDGPVTVLKKPLKISQLDQAVKIAGR